MEMYRSHAQFNRHLPSVIYAGWYFLNLSGDCFHLSDEYALFCIQG
jgi:hypothetical protein